MKIIKVQVTQEHIDRGKRDRCQDCPVALALSEHFRPGFSADWGVFTRGLQIESFLIPFPPEVTTWIKYFDDSLSSIGAGRHLNQPIEFDLEIPTWASYLFV
jgi:hypothetical protein